MSCACRFCPGRRLGFSSRDAFCQGLGKGPQRMRGTAGLLVWKAPKPGGRQRIFILASRHFWRTAAESLRANGVDVRPIFQVQRGTRLGSRHRCILS